MQRASAEASYLTEQQRKLVDLLEECTHKEQPSVPQSALTGVKETLRAGSNDDVRVAFDTLLGRIGNAHAQARLAMLLPGT